MKVNFSRHAKRRAKLYNISEETVEKLVEAMHLEKGRHKILKHVVDFKYPLKIVVDVEDNVITIITNYPLKKGISDESTL